MIPSFAEQDQVAGDSTFIGRIRQALIKKAGLVRIGPGPTVLTWPTHKMAQQVLERPDEWAARMAMALVTQPSATTVPPYMTDAEIEDGISTLFVAFFEVPPLVTP